MVMFYIITVVKLIFILAVIHTHGQSINLDEVDRTIKEILGCHTNNPGLAIAVVKDDNVLFTKGYGVEDIQTKSPVTSASLFGLGSLTKAFTATLLLHQLDQYKNMSIYTHVADILGDSFEFSTDIRTQNANLRDILSHSLGFPSHNYIRFDRTLSRGKLSRRIKYLHSIYPFRSTYLYNNIMYGLASYVSEKLGHRSWENLIQDEIFTQLGMASSTFLTKVDPLKQDVAQGYTEDHQTGLLVPVPFETQRYWDIMPGATSVMSNADDISKWMQFLLNGGRSSSGIQVVAADTLANTFKPRNTIISSSIQGYFTKPKVPVTTTVSSYGLGWKIGYYRGYRMVRHTGSIAGYSSLITLLPDVKIGIFTTMTGPDYDYVFRTLMHNYLADLTLNQTPWLNSSTICSFPEPWFQVKQRTRHHINKQFNLYRPHVTYVGHYTNDLYGVLEIRFNSTIHHLELIYGVGRWILYPQHTHDHFAGEATGLLESLVYLWTVKFTTDSQTSNVIDKVEVTSFEPTDPPIFQKKSHNVNIVG